MFWRAVSLTLRHVFQTFLSCRQHVLPAASHGSPVLPSVRRVFTRPVVLRTSLRFFACLASPLRLSHAFRTPRGSFACPMVLRASSLMVFRASSLVASCFVGSSVLRCPVRRILGLAARQTSWCRPRRSLVPLVVRHWCGRGRM